MDYCQTILKVIIIEPTLHNQLVCKGRIASEDVINVVAKEIYYHNRLKQVQPTSVGNSPYIVI